MLKTIFQYILQQYEFFLPNYCLMCRIHQTEFGICTSCCVKLPWQQHCCIQCANPLECTTLCGQCLQHPPAYDQIFAPLLYEKPIQHFITQLKFHANLKTVNALAYLFASAFKKSNMQLLPQVLLPVPLHIRRLKKRGFNQALELSKALAKLLDIPLNRHGLIKTIATAPQSKQDYHVRLCNIKNSFALTQPINMKHVAIVDDVITTGSTVNEIARILKEHGVERVTVLAIARTSKTRAAEPRPLGSGDFNDICKSTAP